MTVKSLSFLTVEEALEIVHGFGWNIGRAAFCQLLRQNAARMGCVWYQDEESSERCYHYISEAKFRRWIDENLIDEEVPEFAELTEEVS